MNSENPKKNIWTWAAIGLFDNYFQSYEVGETFRLQPMLPCNEGEYFEVLEFNMKWLRKAKTSALSCLTGREMLLQCVRKEMDRSSDMWGTSIVTLRGEAEFRILYKVSNDFDVMSLY